MKAAELVAAFGALVGAALPGIEAIQQRMETFHLGPLTGRPREVPADESVLRATGRWSPAMEKPHSQRKWHIRIPGPKPQHFWRDAEAPFPFQTSEFPSGTVIEMVNGWGQVVQRTWM